MSTAEVVHVFVVLSASANRKDPNHSRTCFSASQAISKMNGQGVTRFICVCGRERIVQIIFDSSSSLQDLIRKTYFTVWMTKNYYFCATRDHS